MMHPGSSAASAGIMAMRSLREECAGFLAAFGARFSIMGTWNIGSSLGCKGLSSHRKIQRRKPDR